MDGCLGWSVRATARIVAVGGGLYVAEIDGEDGTHVDFRPQRSPAECMRQIQWASRGLGLAVSLDPSIALLPGLICTGSVLPPAVPNFATMPSAPDLAALSPDEARTTRQAKRQAVRDRNNKVFDAFLEAERASADRVESERRGRVPPKKSAAAGGKRKRPPAPGVQADSRGAQ